MGESFVESVMLKLTKYKNINDGFKDGFKNGSHKSCDMTVEDIYGGGCEFLGMHFYNVNAAANNLVCNLLVSCIWFVFT